jgi:hypothetical protein
MGQTCSHCCGSTRPELDGTNIDLKEKLLDDNNHQLDIMEDPSQSMERALTIQKSKNFFEGHRYNSMNFDEMEENQYEDEVRSPSAASRPSRPSRSRVSSISSRNSSSSYTQQRATVWDAAADTSHNDGPTTNSSSSKSPTLSSNIQPYVMNNVEEDVDNDHDLSDNEIKREDDDSFNSVSRFLSSSSSPKSQVSQRSISEDSYASTKDFKRFESRGVFRDDGSSMSLRDSADGGKDAYGEKADGEDEEDDFTHYDDKGRYTRGKIQAQNPNTSFADCRRMLDHYDTSSNARGNSSDSDDPY